jgi:hypothetical protein
MLADKSFYYGIRMKPVDYLWSGTFKVTSTHHCHPPGP